MNLKNWKLIAFKFMIFGSIQFVVLTFIAMLFYPGGTHIDPNTKGYSFFQNFFSDLGRTVAYSGKENIVSYVMFTITLTILGVSIIFYFSAIPFFFKEKNFERYLSIIGSLMAIMTGISLAGVAFTPYDIFPSAHVFFGRILLISLFLALVIYTLIIFFNNDYPNKYALTYFIFSLIVGIYILVARFRPDISTTEGLILQVTSQKIFFYSWITCFSVEAYGSQKLSSS